LLYEKDLGHKREIWIYLRSNDSISIITNRCTLFLPERCESKNSISEELLGSFRTLDKIGKPELIAKELMILYEAPPTPVRFSTFMNSCVSSVSDNTAAFLLANHHELILKWFADRVDTRKEELLKTKIHRLQDEKLISMCSSVISEAKFLEPWDKHLMELYNRSSDVCSILEEKKLIEEFLKAFNQYKRECEEHGECCVKYFTDMYEHYHSSNNTFFSFAEPRKERLAYINANLETLLANEELKKRLLSTLTTDVEALICSNPGIRQGELIRKFDPIVKKEITNLLNQWVKKNKIKREKQGRFNTITLV